ncbi:MAG: DUF167 domain-containing protein [Candidatus Kariarchaeaceae archaeon]
MSKKKANFSSKKKEEAKGSQHQVFRVHKNDIIIRFLVKPGAIKTKVPSELFSDHVVVMIQAPPDKGKANRELLKELKKLLDVNSSDLVLERGQTSSEKYIRVKNQDLQTVYSKFIAKI